jgi:hypothetical protein
VLLGWARSPYVKNEMPIGDGLTQYAHVIGHAFHLAIIVVDANVTVGKRHSFLNFFMFLRADVHILTYLHRF